MKIKYILALLFLVFCCLSCKAASGLGLYKAFLQSDLNMNGHALTNGTRISLYNGSGQVIINMWGNESSFRSNAITSGGDVRIWINGTERFRVTDNGEVIATGLGFVGAGVGITTFNADNITTGTLAGGRFPALTGDVTNAAGSLVTGIKAAVALSGAPTTTTASAGDSSTKIATTAYVVGAASYGSYKTIAQASASHTAAVVAGTYFLANGNVAGVTGTGTLYPPVLIHIVGADYPTVNGVAPKLRIRVVLAVNDVAPTGNFTFGLYPVTRPGTSGGTGLDIYTMGTVVSGSNGATFTTPAADSLGTAVSADFALPADGVYVIGVVTTATVAASSHLHMQALLQYHNN